MSNPRKLTLCVSVVLISGAAGLLAWHLRELMLLGYMDSAIGSVRVVVSSEQEYVRLHPEIGFTCQPAELSADAFSRLEAKKWNGYAFELAGCDAKQSQKPNARYQILAWPLNQELPAYCSDQSGIVRRDENGSVEACLRNGETL